MTSIALCLRNKPRQLNHGITRLCFVSARLTSQSRQALPPYTRRPVSILASKMADLNNTSAMRQMAYIEPDPRYSHASLALSEAEDDARVRNTYCPFLLSTEISEQDWIAELELSTVLKMMDQHLSSGNERIKVLVLYGSLRKR